MMTRTLTTALLLAAVVATPLAPRPAAAQEDDAAAAWAAGDHPRARELYAARVAADSADVQAAHRLGLLLSWNREYDRGLPLLERVVRLQPSVAARTDLANVLAWSGRYDRALAVLGDVLAEAPTRELEHTRARFLSWAGRYDESAAAYRALLERDAADAEALRGIARVTTWGGDLAAGERLWRAALAAEPENPDARVGLSQVLRWRGRGAEALEHARAAAGLRPNDREVLEQLAWAEAAYAPRIAPSFSAETDSDRNRLYTAAVTASVPFSPRMGATLHAYLRRADGPTPPGFDPTPASWSALAGLRAEVAGGWALSGAAGMTDRSAGDPAAIYRAGLSSPTWLPVSASAAYAHTVMDATADLIGRHVTLDDVSLTAAAEPARALRLEVGAALTRFDGETANERQLGRVGLEVRPNAWLRVRPRATAFRFDRTVQEGYFAPDEYAMAELGVGVDRYRSSWSFSAEAAPGAQRIGSTGDWKGAFSARGRVGLTVAPGREVGIGVTFSELGMERLAAGEAGYRYQAVVVSGAWGF